MAFSTTIFHPSLLRNPNPLYLPGAPSQLRHIKPLTLKSPFPSPSLSLTLKSPTHIKASSSSSSSSFSFDSTSPIRTVASVLAAAFSLFRTLSQRLLRPATGDEAARIAALRGSCRAVGPLFFATRSTLNTPLMVVASGMRQWLAIYSGVLFIRVLLSWFPNIPWERQPLSAMRDLCDPYLNLFRNIIPPVFDTLDVSPILAFGVLGLFEGIMDGVGI